MTKKDGRGGARKGAGRKPTGSSATKNKFIRCNPKQAKALDKHLNAINKDLKKDGISKMSFNKWALEVLLYAAEAGDLIEDPSEI